jgi:hypothetical protein
MKGKIIKRNSKYLHTYLTNDEKKLLFKKYTSMGYSNEEADNKINKITNHINKLTYTWKQENIEKKELNRRFQEEFAKLISQ